MGLSQELVDHIIATLHDDLPALKACSLTCKAMFASTRHLVHQTLCLTPRNNESILTREEEWKFRHMKQGYWKIPLRFLSYMGERGFLQYTRKIYIRNALQNDIPYSDTFAPDTLSPHMHHSESLDRVHAIAIERYDTEMWARRHRNYFAHFYPTLTSLTLHRPLGHYKRILQFALQFPNLEMLRLEWLDGHMGRAQPDLTAPIIGDRSTLTRGHLRLAHFDSGVRWETYFAHASGVYWWPRNFVRELRNGFNFRSVELEDSFEVHG